MNIHDQARKFLANDGLRLTDSQKKAVFEFADYVFANDPSNKAAQRHAENLARIAELEAKLASQQPRAADAKTTRR